jgi:hypothetical protein
MGARGHEWRTGGPEDRRARDTIGRDSTTCCPKCHTFQVAGGSPWWQVAESAFPNRQPLTASTLHG